MSQYTFKTNNSNMYYVINAECIEQAFSVLYFDYGISPTSVIIEPTMPLQ
jgi:hypothetical protein